MGTHEMPHMGPKHEEVKRKTQLFIFVDLHMIDGFTSVDEK